MTRPKELLDLVSLTRRQAMQDDGIHVLESYKPTNPKITNTADDRSADNYLAVVKQFDVENNHRYTPDHAGHGETYCNIFLWDVTKAMNAEIPHWADSSTGYPTPMGKGVELNANAVVNWLVKDTSANTVEAESHGWREIPEPEAAIAASAGRPTVAVWRNPVGIGHVAMVIPSSEKGTRLAAAGTHCYADCSVQQSFGGRNVRYFYHE